MSEQPPELRWAPLQPRPRNGRRLWLIIGLAVAALAIAGVLLFFLLPRGETPDPGASGSPTPSGSSVPTATPTATPTPTASPEPSAPVATPPPVSDPELPAFRDRTGTRLEDALTGLGFVADAGDPAEATSIVDQLQADAQRLAEALPPASIETEWHDGVAIYGDALGRLRSAIEAGSGVEAELGSARDAVESLQKLISD